MEKNTEKAKELLEKACNSDFFYLMMGSMITSDGLMTPQDCTKRLSDIVMNIEAAKIANMPDDKKECFLKYAKDALRIVCMDLQEFYADNKENKETLSK